MRGRIGAVPLELLFAAMTRPTPTRRRSRSHAFGLQLCARAGTEIALADTGANPDESAATAATAATTATAATAATGVGAPKARVLALMTCGTRQLLGAVIGSLNQGEPPSPPGCCPARPLPRLGAGMLLLADRNLLGYNRLWTAAAATGADLLWRAKNNCTCRYPRPCPTGRT
jgi:hypothetical protein